MTAARLILIQRPTKRTARVSKQGVAPHPTPVSKTGLEMKMIMMMISNGRPMMMMIMMMMMIILRKTMGILMVLWYVVLENH